jgi:hypothetical protein
MQTTKLVNVLGKEFTIKRLTYGEKADTFRSKDQHEIVMKMVMYGTQAPPFKSVDEVASLDWEIVEGLYTEIQEFNAPNKSFLERLQKLQ